MRYFTIILLSLTLFNLQVSAQRRVRQTSARTLARKYQTHANSVVQKLHDRLDSIAVQDSQQADTQLTVSPYLCKLVGPMVYYGSSVGRRFQLDWHRGAPQQQDGLSAGIVYRDQLANAIDDALICSYINRPTTVKYYDKQIDREQIVGEAIVAASATSDLDNILGRVNAKKDVADVVGPLDIGLKIQKPNFWNKSGKFGLQLTQNYVSANWYKGGNNNMTLLTSLLLEANYNDQRRLQWDNKLEMRLGFVTVPSDTVHEFLTNNDKIYLFSKLGLNAFESFFYTAQVEAQSQFMPGYKSNDTTAYSRFLAPLDVYVAIGIDYKPKLKNGNTLSLAFLPIAYKLRYIDGGDPVIIKAYKIRDGNRAQNDFGSKIEFNANLKLLKNFSWRSRLYYFSTYKYSEAELENVFSFSFNKYITAEFYALWRYDDNRDMKYWDESLGFFQFKEYFTLGLSYNF